MITLNPSKAKDTSIKGKIPTPSMGVEWSKPGFGRGGKHKDVTKYSRKREKAIPRE